MRDCSFAPPKSELPDPRDPFKLRIGAYRPRADIIGDGPNLCSESVSIPAGPVTGRTPGDTPNPAATPKREPAPLSLDAAIERLRQQLGGFPKSNEPQRDVNKIVEALGAGKSLDEALVTSVIHEPQPLVKDHPKPDYYHGPMMPPHMRRHRAAVLAREENARLVERTPSEAHHITVHTPDAEAFRKSVEAKPAPSFWLGGNKVTIRQLRDALWCLKQDAKVIGHRCCPVKAILQTTGRILIANDAEYPEITVVEFNRALRQFNQDAEVIGPVALPLKHIFSQSDGRVLLSELGSDDKTFEDCKNKFDNIAHFCGSPDFNPVPRPISSLPEMPYHTGGCWGGTSEIVGEHGGCSFPTPVWRTPRFPWDPEPTYTPEDRSVFEDTGCKLAEPVAQSRRLVSHNEFINACEAIWTELKYQNALPRRTADEAKDTAGFATLLRNYTAKLEAHWADKSGVVQPEGNVAVSECLDDFRKIAAIAVRAMAYLGVRERIA